jgi:hypothetical protein
MTTMKNLLIVLAVALLATSCRSTRNISDALARKDTAVVVVINPAESDSAKMVHETLEKIQANHIDFKTFSAKVHVDYSDSKDKKYDFNTFIRIRKDSVIWVSIIAALGIEAFRVTITPDSIRILDKLNKTFDFKSLDYIQDVAKLPIDFKTLQDLLIGNPVYLDSNIVAYKKETDMISMSMLGTFFKNLVTVDAKDFLLTNSKLDDVDIVRSRSANLTYSDYGPAGKWRFSNSRIISITEKNKLDIGMEFKQVVFDGPVEFPFNIPKNYKLK